MALADSRCPAISKIFCLSAGVRVCRFWLFLQESWIQLNQLPKVKGEFLAGPSHGIRGMNLKYEYIRSLTCKKVILKERRRGIHSYMYTYIKSVT